MGILIGKLIFISKEMDEFLNSKTLVQIVTIYISM